MKYEKLIEKVRHGETASGFGKKINAIFVYFKKSEDGILAAKNFKKMINSDPKYISIQKAKGKTSTVILEVRVNSPFDWGLIEFSRAKRRENKKVEK